MDTSLAEIPHPTKDECFELFGVVARQIIEELDAQKLATYSPF